MKYTKMNLKVRQGHRGGNLPAGTKLVRRFYRIKHGIKGTVAEAFAWWRAFHKNAGYLR